MFAIGRFHCIWAKVHQILCDTSTSEAVVLLSSVAYLDASSTLRICLQQLENDSVRYIFGVRILFQTEAFTSTHVHLARWTNIWARKDTGITKLYTFSNLSGYVCASSAVENSLLDLASHLRLRMSIRQHLLNLDAWPIVWLLINNFN